MFCEMGHLVMTSVQVNVEKFTNKCSPDDEVMDVVTQTQSTFDPDWRRAVLSKLPDDESYLHAMLSV